MFSVSTFVGFNPKVFHHDSHFDSNKASLCLSIQSLKETYSLKSCFLSPVCVATTFQPLKTASQCFTPGFFSKTLAPPAVWSQNCSFDFPENAPGLLNSQQNWTGWRWNLNGFLIKCFPEDRLHTNINTFKAGLIILETGTQGKSHCGRNWNNNLKKMSLIYRLCNFVFPWTA